MIANFLDSMLIKAYIDMEQYSSFSWATSIIHAVVLYEGWVLGNFREKGYQRTKCGIYAVLNGCFRIVIRGRVGRRWGCDLRSRSFEL